MDTFLVLLGLLALIELGVALGWAQDSRDDRDRWPFHGDWRHDASNEPSGKDIPSTTLPYWARGQSRGSGKERRMRLYDGRHG